MQIRRIAVATLAAGLAVGLVAAPGHAKTRSFHDRHGDVGHGADIKRVKVTYNKRGVHVRIKVRNAADKQQSGIVLYYNSANVYFDVRRGRPGPEFRLSGPIAPPGSGYDWNLLRTKSNWRVRSRAALCKSSIKTKMRRDVVHVRIAKPCLRNPDMVNLNTGQTIHNKPHKAPKRIRVAVRTDRHRSASDWAPRKKRFYRAVRRG